MTTMMNEWATGQEGGDGAPGDEVVDETLGAEGGPEEELEAPQHESTKGKTNRKTLMLAIGGGVLAAAAIGGVMFSKVTAMQQQAVASEPQSQPVAQANTAPADSGNPIAQPVAGVVAAPIIGNEQPAPVMAAAPVEAAPAPVAAPQPIAPSVQAPAMEMPAPSLTPSAPAPVLASRPNLNTGVAQAQPAVQPQPQAVTAAAEAEAAKLRDEVQALQAEVGKLTEELKLSKASAARWERAAKAKPKPTIVEVYEGAKPSAVAKPAAAAAKPAAAASAAVAAVPAPKVTKPGSREDFVIYAIADGRAWVTYIKGDGENHSVVGGSVLPDGSRVTKVDDIKGVVTTTAGDIYPKTVAR